MAIWQFDVHYLPRVTVESRHRIQPIALSREEFDSVDWWAGIGVPAAVAERLSKMLPPAVSWSEHIRKWGQEDGNRIDLSYQNGTLSGMFVRIDVREISYRFLVDVVDLAARQDWLLCLHDMRILSPSVVGLMTAIQRSNSFRFVLDPVRFLEQLEKRRRADAGAPAGANVSRDKL